MASINRERDRRDHSRTAGWRVRWRDENGRQRSKLFKRQTEARTWMDRIDLARVRTESGPTLSQLYSRWEATRRVSHARSVADRSLSKHFGDLGAKPVNEIVRSDLLAWIAGLEDSGLSAATIGACLHLVRSTLTVAAGDRMIEHNPAANVRAPVVKKAALDSSDVLTAEELQLLLPVIPGRWRALIALLGFVGPRWSEALAITPRDLDLLHRTVHVGQKIIEEVNGNRVQRQGGKTRGSDRQVPLPRIVADSLELHLSNHPTNPTGLVFRNEADHSPSRSNFRRRVWQPAMITLGELLVERAGDDPEQLVAAELRAAELRSIPVRNLRHTAASLMLGLGLPILDVANRLGHSRPSMTLDIYARLLPRDQDRPTDPYDAGLSLVFDHDRAAHPRHTRTDRVGSEGVREVPGNPV